MSYRFFTKASGMISEFLSHVEKIVRIDAIGELG
jgi:hypothetical protein